MKITRAFSSLGCPEFSLSEVLALATRHGIGHVELRALGGTIDLPDYFRREWGSPEALAEMLGTQPVRVAVLGTSLRLIGGDDAAREKFLEFLPWAEALGGVPLRVFDGGKTGDRAEIAAGLETLHWWRALREKRGWRSEILVESHDSLVTGAALGRLLEASPGVKVLWDTHHTWKKGGESPAETWRAIGPAVAHVHVKDSISKPSERHPHTYVLPGDGEFPMPALRAVLEAGDYSKLVCLEWEKQWHPYLAPLAEALTVADKRAWW